MRIAFFTQNLGNYISGGRQYPWLLGHCLAYAGHEVLFLTNTPENPLFDRDFTNFPNRKNITIHKDSCYGTKNKDIVNKLKGYDLFIASPMESLDYAVTLGRMHGKKIVGLVYEPFNMLEEAISEGIEIPQLNQNVISDFCKNIVRTDMIICNNKTTLGYLKQWLPMYKGKTEYLYNGFNTDIADKVPLVPRNKRENSIVYLSRTAMYKGFGDIPYIFGQIDFKPTIHYISGFIDDKNPNHIKFFDLCKQANLNLIVHNRITEIEKFKILASAKALFFPSRFEGFGIPPAEAMYMNTPVICYDLPVLKEVYGDFPHYIPFGDVNAALTLVDELSKDEDRLFKDYQKLRGHVEKFARLDVLANGFNKLICTLMKKTIDPIVVKRPIQQEIPKDEPKDNTSIKIVDLETLNKIQKFDEAYLILKDPKVKLNEEKIFREIKLRMGDNDFLTFNYKIGDKEKCSLGMDVDAQFVRPGYLGGVVVCRASVMADLIKTFGEFDENWELDLALKTQLHEWFHCPIIAFEVQEKKEYSLNRCARLIRKYYDNITVGKYFDVDVVDNHIQIIPDRIKENVGIIICARTNDYLPRLLTSLNQQMRENYTVTLCLHDPDGKHCPHAESTFRKMMPDGELLKFDGPFNFSTMNNAAFKKIKFGEYIVLCNDDIVLRKDTISNLVAGFKYRFNNVGVIGAKLLYPENNNYDFEMDWAKDKHLIQHAGISLLQDKRCLHFLHKHKANKLSVNYFRLHQAVTFGLVAIDAECFQQIMLDEDLPNDLNDIDFCVRAAAKSWEILYNPLAVAYHLNTMTRSKFNIQDDYKGKDTFKKAHKELLAKQMSLADFNSTQRNLM